MEEIITNKKQKKAKAKTKTKAVADFWEYFLDDLDAYIDGRACPVGIAVCATLLAILIVGYNIGRANVLNKWNEVPIVNSVEIFDYTCTGIIENEENSEYQLSREDGEKLSVTADKSELEIGETVRVYNVAATKKTAEINVTKREAVLSPDKIEPAKRELESQLLNSNPLLDLFDFGFIALIAIDGVFLLVFIATIVTYFVSSLYEYRRYELS